MPDMNNIVEQLLNAHRYVLMGEVPLGVDTYILYRDKLNSLRKTIKDMLEDLSTSERNFCPKHTNQKFDKCPVCYGQEIREERDKLKKLLPMNNMNTDYTIDYNLVEKENHLMCLGYQTKMEDGKLWYAKDPSTGWIYFVPSTSCLK